MDNDKMLNINGYDEDFMCRKRLYLNDHRKELKVRLSLVMSIKIVTFRLDSRPISH